MGRAIIIKDADFSATAYGQVQDTVSGTFTPVTSGLFLTSAKNSLGRYINYDSSTSPARITLFNEDRLLYVPKGASITLFGISGLCLDFACYDKNHDWRDWRMTSATKCYQNGTYISNMNSYTDGTLKYERLVTTGYQEKGSAYAVTNGSVSSYTFTNNYDGEWFLFCAKRSDGENMTPSDYNVSYSITFES